MHSEIKILGTTEEVNSCARCGRNDLEKTYTVSAEGEILYLGSSCIAHRFEFGSVSKVQTFIKKELQKRKKELRIKIEKAVAPIEAEMEKLEVFSYEWEKLYEKTRQIEDQIKSKIAAQQF